MQVRRIFDPAELNAVVNIPEILQYVAPGYQSFDLSDFIADRRNVVLSVSQSFNMYAYLKDGVYEGHFLHPPNMRGKLALDHCKKMLTEMFTTHGASVIGGPISRDHRAARVMARVLGLKPVGKSRDPLGHECIDYAIERDEWAVSLD